MAGASEANPRPNPATRTASGRPPKGVGRRSQSNLGVRSTLPGSAREPDGRAVPADRAGALTMRGPQALEQERERWRQRERRILDALQAVDDERQRLDEELLKVEQQIAYYDSLTREMKRELGRPGLSGLLSSLHRP